MLHNYILLYYIYKNYLAHLRNVDLLEIAFHLKYEQRQFYTEINYTNTFYKRGSNVNTIKIKTLWTIIIEYNFNNTLMHFISDVKNIIYVNE